MDVVREKNMILSPAWLVTAIVTFIILGLERYGFRPLEAVITSFVGVIALSYLIEIFFARPVLRMLIQQPLVASNRHGQYDVVCTVSGGGLSGQAGAVRHGLSKALTNYEPDLRGVLKRGGFLTRDSRVVERKKYGKAKARRSFQFSKR